MLRSAWRRIGPMRSSVRVQVVLDGAHDGAHDGATGTLLPSALAHAPRFTYYVPQALAISSVSPIGGPVVGGTAVTLHGAGFAPLGSPVRCKFGALLPNMEAREVAADGSSLVCTTPPQPDAKASLIFVGNHTFGAGQRAVAGGPSVPPLSLRWTADACHSSGAYHAAQCTSVDEGRAAFSCCSLDGRTCHAMCISPISGAMYQQHEPGGSLAAHVSLGHAESLCRERLMRLCTLHELERGVCCGSGCALDDARVWTHDDCTTPLEHTLLEALPLRPERLRVSVNGQQYGGVVRSTDLPERRAARVRRHNASEPYRSGFTYYSTAHLRLSAVVPAAGPVAGGTLLTLLGMGFVDGL